MIGRILLYGFRVERVSILKSKDGFVLGAVILVDAANVLPKRNSPDEEQKQYQADAAVDQVENNPATEGGIDLLKFGSRQKRDVFVHEDEEGQRDHDVDGGQPVAESGGFLAAFGSR